jgi:hypothetical protein
VVALSAPEPRAAHGGYAYSPLRGVWAALYLQDPFFEAGRWLGAMLAMSFNDTVVQDRLRMGVLDGLSPLL